MSRDFIIELPLRIPSTTNLREHWAAKMRRARAHRRAMIVVPPQPLPCIVALIRIAPRRLDNDNAVAAMKHVRDGIATRLGVDDADPRVQWQYGQVKEREYGLRIEIRQPWAFPNAQEAP